MSSTSHAIQAVHFTDETEREERVTACQMQRFRGSKPRFELMLNETNSLALL
jgi:hypothetical protein